MSVVNTLIISIVSFPAEHTRQCYRLTHSVRMKLLHPGCDSLPCTNYKSQLKRVHVTTDGSAHDTAGSTYFLPCRTVQTYSEMPREAHYPVW